LIYLALGLDRKAAIGRRLIWRSASDGVARGCLFYWYAQLKALEASFGDNLTDKRLAEKQAEIERIEEAVSHIRFP
jgi:hypothetical protein